MNEDYEISEEHKLKSLVKNVVGGGYNNLPKKVVQEIYRDHFENAKRYNIPHAQRRWKKYFLIDCNMTRAKQRVNGATIEQIAMKG